MRGGPGNHQPRRGQVTVYALAQLNVHDPDRYGQYVTRFLPVLKRFGGRLLAANAPEVLEGSSPYRRAVLLAFADRASFEAWARSPDYAEIVVDRHAASEGVVILLEGFQGQPA